MVKNRQSLDFTYSVESHVLGARNPLKLKGLRPILDRFYRTPTPKWGTAKMAGRVWGDFGGGKNRSFSPPNPYRIKTYDCLGREIGRVRSIQEIAKI